MEARRVRGIVFVVVVVVNGVCGVCARGERAGAAGGEVRQVDPRALPHHPPVQLVTTGNALTNQRQRLQPRGYLKTTTPLE